MAVDIPPDAIVSRTDETGAPTELLVTHAEQVASRAQWLAAAGTTDDARTLECLGRLHDVGKAVPAFQQYIRNQPYLQRKHTFHARLGAFAVVHVLSEMDAPDREVLAGWAAVLRHHGVLPDLTVETIRVLRSEWKRDSGAWAEAQVAMIADSPRSRTVFNELLSQAADGSTDWDCFRVAMDERRVHRTLLDALGLRTRCPRERWEEMATVPPRTYDRTLRLWSALTLADKTIASGSVDRSDLSPDTLALESLEGHVSELLSTSGVDDSRIADAMVETVQPEDEASLNALREAARRRVRDAAPKLLGHEVGLLTLPTGLGKTFSGITAAFTLRDAMQRQRGLETPPRVVYALPYTSIIEQIREVFEDQVFDADPTGRAFTTHHYLTETVTYPDNEGGPDGTPMTDTDHSRAKLLGESWRSGVVLTTFVQLIESLAGPSNAAGLKLSALRDSVVILDEPQAVPKPWWGAVRRLMRLLIDEFDARVISMTATQPTLFTAADFDTMSLVSPGGNDSFERRAYESVSRVRYQVDESIAALTASETESAEPVGHAVAAKRLIETAISPESNAASSSVLSVCSTVASSRTLTDQVSEQAPLFGVTPTHIGRVYQATLERLDDVGDGPTPNAHPDPKALADATLRRLGFSETDDGEWDRDEDGDDRLLIGTFNARYRPVDRRVLIRIADALSTTSVPFVFVSTQAIEAGVDISFTHAFRDIAPLDSIVQTAGRCNRSFEWGVEGGAVTVWCLAGLDDEESTLPAEYIYPESGHLHRIATLLLNADAESDSESIAASTLELETVQEYFTFVEERGFLNVELKPWIDTCEAERLYRESLLDGYETVDILVAATTADDERIEHLRRQFDAYEGLGYEHLSELSGMRVSVSVREMEDLPLHTRADGTSRQSESGVDVFVHPTNHGRGSYDLAQGGFTVTEDEIVNRFT